MIGMVAILLRQAAVLVLASPVCLAIIIILHETGHLVGGLMSGYKFSSFTLFTVALCKSQNGFVVKRNCGMVGQCLMYSEKLNADPCLLVAGGAVMNLFMGVCACMGSLLVLTKSISGGMILAELGILSLCIGISNLIPNAEKRNDGDTLKLIRRGGYNVRIYNALMRITDGVMNGKMLSEIDEELFVRHPARQNSLAGEMALLKYQRAQEKSLEEAEDFAQAMQSNRACLEIYLAECNELKDFAYGVQSEKEIFEIMFGQKFEHNSEIAMDKEREFLAQCAGYIKNMMLDYPGGFVKAAEKRQKTDMYGGLWKGILKITMRYSKLCAERDNKIERFKKNT